MPETRAGFYLVLLRTQQQQRQQAEEKLPFLSLTSGATRKKPGSQQQGSRQVCQRIYRDERAAEADTFPALPGLQKPKQVISTRHPGST